jgi:SAM-dependent methyltransferase
MPQPARTPPAHAAFAELQNAFGFFESIEERGPVLLVYGFALLADGPFDAMELVAPGLQVLRFQRMVRPDVLKLHPMVAASDQSGFVAELSLYDLPACDHLEFSVVGLRGGRPVAKMTGYHHRLARPILPPAHLRMRVIANDSLAFFHASGVKNCHDFLRAAARYRPLSRLRRVLDWGSGCGRLAMHLIERLPHAEVSGADLDREAVAWCSENLPRGRFQATGTEPPLPWPDQHFDLVIATSVFTHLTAPLQTAWLRELRRLLTPGGILLASTQGRLMTWFCTGELAEELLRDGIHDATVADTLRGVIPDGYYRSTWQTREYTESVWGRELEILDYIEGGNHNHQDLVVLRRS